MFEPCKLAVSYIFLAKPMWLAPWFSDRVKRPTASCRRALFFAFNFPLVRPWSSHAGVASKMFRVLADENVNIRMVSTSEIKISVVIDEKHMELAVNALHKAFGLDKANVESE